MPTNIDIWSDYAKERFESASKRVDEFRNWARQLGTAVAVLVGLEVTLLGRVLDLDLRLGHGLRIASLVVFLFAVIVQTILLFDLLKSGYVGTTLIGPESPVTLWPYIKTEDANETQRIIGSYFANSHDKFHALGEELADKVGRATRILAATIVLFLVGVLLLVLSVAILPSSMAEPAPKPTTDPQTPCGQTEPGGQGPPIQGRPLPTPTDGLPTTAGDKAPLLTPTVGLDMTKILFPLTPQKKK